jgi:hypothetical protein
VICRNSGAVLKKFFQITHRVVFRVLHSKRSVAALSARAISIEGFFLINGELKKLVDFAISALLKVV